MNSLLNSKLRFTFISKKLSVMVANSRAQFHYIKSDKGNTADNSHAPATEYLEIKSDITNCPRTIAYKKTKGARNVGLIYVPGFMSNKSGDKALALETFSKQYGFNYIRYDATGLGESKSISLENARFTHWLEDAQEVLLKLTETPQIIVGSSMGGWISLLLAAKYPEKVHSLVLISPGINFVQRFMEKFEKSIAKSDISRIENGETYRISTDYGNFPVSLELARDMIEQNLDLEKGLAIDCPVRIIHGIQDASVPYIESLDIMKSLRSSDVELTYVKNGQHRLCEKNNLELICDTILKLDSVSN